MSEDEKKADTTQSEIVDEASLQRQESTTAAAGKRTGMFGASGTGDTSGYGGLEQPILYPGAATKPYGSWFDAVDESLHNAGLGEGIEKIVIHRGEMTVHVKRENLYAVMQHLRDDPALRFEYCSGVGGVNYPDDVGAELHTVYHVMSYTYNRNLRIECSCPDADPHVPSVVGVYPALDWHERETWDMFGIIFDDHPALTRILMPDDWPGHPQRKDYPLGGIPVEYKGGTIPPPDERRSYN